jgi:hypothetical protein
MPSNGFGLPKFIASGAEEAHRLAVLSEEPEEIPIIAPEKEPRTSSTAVETEDAVGHSVQPD